MIVMSGSSNLGFYQIRQLYQIRSAHESDHEQLNTSITLIYRLFDKDVDKNL